MPRAFVSWLGLHTHDLFGPLGKLATVWFDQLILQLPRHEGLEKMVDYVGRRSGLSEACQRKLLAFWKSAEKDLPGCNWTVNPWDSIEDERLMDLAAEARIEELREKYPGIDENGYQFHNAVAMGTAGLLQSLSAWGALNAQAACAMIPNKLESKALSAMLTYKSARAFEVFQSLAEQRVPDLSALSWERVIELREHPFLQDFRSKLDYVQVELQKNGVKEVASIIEEIERRDLIQIAKLCRPAPCSAIWKAVGSNIPLPIPVNPVSIGLAIKEISESYRLRSKFGWLYFLIDFEGHAD